MGPTEPTVCPRPEGPLTRRQEKSPPRIATAEAEEASGGGRACFVFRLGAEHVLSASPASPLSNISTSIIFLYRCVLPTYDTYLHSLHTPISHLSVSQQSVTSVSFSSLISHLPVTCQSLTSQNQSQFLFQSLQFNMRCNFSRIKMCDCLNRDVAVAQVAAAPRVSYRYYRVDISLLVRPWSFFCCTTLLEE